MSLEYASLGPESGFPIMTDPLVDHVFDAVREYQKELDYTPSPNEDYLEDIVQELDEMWQFGGSIIGVSGFVKSGVIDQTEQVIADDSDVADYQTAPAERVAAIIDAEGRPLTKRYFVNDQSFMSCGFAIENEPWPEKIGGGEIGRRAVIKLMLRRLVGFNLDNGEQETCNLYTTALIHEVSLDLPYVSDEMAEMWSRDNFSDSIATIDTLLAGEENVAQKLLALRKVTIPCAEHTTFQDKMVLEQYLHNLIEVEQETMPYVATLRKGAVLFEADDQQHQVFDFLDKETAHLILIQAVRIYSKCKSKIHGDKLTATLDAYNFELRAGINIIGLTADFDTKELEIRLADIKNLRNIRVLLHGE